MRVALATAMPDTVGFLDFTAVRIQPLRGAWAV
jgi:hypothetical protein